MCFLGFEDSREFHSMYNKKFMYLVSLKVFDIGFKLFILGHHFTGVGFGFLKFHLLFQNLLLLCSLIHKVRLLCHQELCWDQSIFVDWFDYLLIHVQSLSNFTSFDQIIDMFHGILFSPKNYQYTCLLIHYYIEWLLLLSLSNLCLYTA